MKWVMDMEDLVKRKPTRLKGYDYSSTGVYFLTICTQNRRCMLSLQGWVQIRSFHGLSRRLSVFAIKNTAKIFGKTDSMTTSFAIEMITKNISNISTKIPFVGCTMNYIPICNSLSCWNCYSSSTKRNLPSWVDFGFCALEIASRCDRGINVDL